MKFGQVFFGCFLAAAGSYKNSGQRCTAIKRMLVHERVADAFVERLVDKTRAWTYGDPMDPKNDMGTVIDAGAAQQFESRVNDAVARGAQLLVGNVRRGALYSPTVIDRVDHKNLNTDVDFLRGVIPTAENLARCFWQQLEPAITEGSLYQVVLHETERNSVCYRGEDE